MNIAIVGVGLIGGSLAICLREKYSIVKKIIGVDANQLHTQQAKELHIVDEILSLHEAIQKADIIFMATPVDVSARLLPEVLDKIHAQQIVVEVGSTKKVICESVMNHPMRNVLIATHPMWGTEHSGPMNATREAFVGRVCIICEASKSNQQHLEVVEQMYSMIGMRIIYIEESRVHDMHLAYISHISHISSFALANTVLEKEKEEEKILQLASSGFETTVRLAKSNFTTWTPILLQNKDFIIDVLNEYINQIQDFKRCLENEDAKSLSKKIENSNQIKKILK